MLLMWSVLVFLAVAAVLILFLRIRSLIEETRKPGKIPRFGKRERYADETRGDRQARMSGDAAYEQVEEERTNAQEMAEDRATMWP